MESLNPALRSARIAPHRLMNLTIEELFVGRRATSISRARLSTGS